MRKKLDNLLERRAHGWSVLTLGNEEPSIKNMNHFHVTYVLIEIVLIWQFFAAQATHLTVCLLLHLLNFLLSMKDKANASELSTANLAVRVYHGFDLFLFAVGCIADWRVMLFHAISSYIVPLCVYGVQTMLLQIWFSEKKIPQFLRECAVAVCLYVTLSLWGLLFGLLMFSSVGVWWFKILFEILYLVIAMPLMTAFEEKEENLFEFAFGLLN